jgi:hypothetical protein
MIHALCIDLNRLLRPCSIAIFCSEVYACCFFLTAPGLHNLTQSLRQLHQMACRRPAGTPAEAGPCGTASPSHRGTWFGEHSLTPAHNTELQRAIDANTIHILRLKIPRRVRCLGWNYVQYGNMSDRLRGARLTSNLLPPSPPWPQP